MSEFEEQLRLLKEGIELVQRELQEIDTLIKMLKSLPFDNGVEEGIQANVAVHLKDKKTRVIN